MGEGINMKVGLIHTKVGAQSLGQNFKMNTEKSKSALPTARKWHTCTDCPFVTRNSKTMKRGRTNTGLYKPCVTVFTHMRERKSDSKRKRLDVSELSPLISGQL